MASLASPEDVAHALGLANAAALSESQALRVDGLLVRVSRKFRREAEREFTPGTTTLRLLTVAGRVHLPDPVDEVGEVTVLDCGDLVTLDTTVEGSWVRLEQDGRCLPSGVEVNVTYTHSEECPEDVVASVAGIVARHLTVDPISAQAQSTELSTTDYRQRFAEWVSSTSLLTEDECEDAHTYRYPGTSIIIQRP